MLLCYTRCKTNIESMPKSGITSNMIVPYIHHSSLTQLYFAV